MSVLKQVVLTMSQGRVEPELTFKNSQKSSSKTSQNLQYRPVAVQSRPKSPAATKSAVFQPRNFVEAEMDETNVHKPAPTEFVSLFLSALKH